MEDEQNTLKDIPLGILNGILDLHFKFPINTIDRCMQISSGAPDTLQDKIALASTALAAVGYGALAATVSPYLLLVPVATNLLMLGWGVVAPYIQECKLNYTDQLVSK